MVTRMMPSDRDLRRLAELVSDDRPDLPGSGLPFSLLRELALQIPCDYIGFQGYDSAEPGLWFAQGLQGDGTPDDTDTVDDEVAQPFWAHYWACQPCSYPDRTGDLRSVFKNADFYSVRQWRSTGMYCDVVRPQGFEHFVMLALPEPPGPRAGPGRTIRLFLYRAPGADFTERDRAILTLLRPHLHQAYLDAERRRTPVPDLTPRQWELMRLIAAGCTNIQIARRLGLSEGTVRTHLENIYSRLEVSNRTAAVARAFPDAAGASTMASA
jgi:DNA-binding CsgD family transcriptional regulator